MNPSIQDIRDYWNRRPCNVRHSDLPIGTREYFDAVEARRYFVEPHNYTFAEFECWKGKRVLEIGCGIGTDAVNFARAGANYTAIELSEKSMEIAQQRFDIYGLQGTFINGDAENLTEYVPLQKFDLIYSYGVIHHGPNPKRVVDQLPVYCNADTEIRMMVYATNSWKSALIDAGYAQPEAQTGCPQVLTYTTQELYDLFAPFNIEVEQDFIFPWVIEEYLQYNYVKEPWFAAMDDELFKALEKRLGWHLLVKGKLRN